MSEGVKCSRCGGAFPEEQVREVRPGRPMCLACRREWYHADLKKESGFGKPGVRERVFRMGRRWGKAWTSKRAVEEFTKGKDGGEEG